MKQIQISLPILMLLVANFSACTDFDGYTFTKDTSPEIGTSSEEIIIQGSDSSPTATDSVTPSDSDEQSDSSPDTGASSDSDSHTGVASGTDVNRDTDTNMGTDTNPGTDMDTATDTNVDTDSGTADTDSTTGSTVDDPCQTNPCLNGGTCRAAGATYSCECTNGYAGSDCARIIFRTIDRVSGTTGPCVARAISGNGTVVVGHCRSTADTGAVSNAYRWENGVTTKLPAQTGSAAANDVDNHGIVVVGWTNTDTVPRLATWAGTQLDISCSRGVGNLGTTGEGISGDGRYLLGHISEDMDLTSTDPSLSQEYVAYWDTVASTCEPTTVFRPIAYMPTEAIGMSDDGSIVIGTDSEAGGDFLWRKSSGSRILLPGFSGISSYGDAIGISGDGNVVVGRTGTLAVRWINGEAPESLGFVGAAQAANVDGSVIVGEAGGAPFIWTAVDGMVLLADALRDRGVDLSAWQLGPVTDISSDGTVVVGDGIYEGGVTRAWIANLNETGIAGR
ncbi:MAG: hypothetical protein JXR76_02035 [Deltaproteobacteria bacterium]|nr:hypothetical protein [Deltaproteobacteria bacterium]